MARLKATIRRLQAGGPGYASPRTGATSSPREAVLAEAVLAEGVEEEVEDGVDDGYGGTGVVESPLIEGREGDVSDGLEQMEE